jgi:hypothetical protein
MRRLSLRLGAFAFAAILGWTAGAAADDQTDTLSPVQSSAGVPFTIQIDQAAFSLPAGLQSFVVGVSGGKWLLLAGRINGLHGFDNSDNNFPANSQNSMVFVVDPVQQTVATRPLDDLQSGLTQEQIDLLSVTGAQSFQSGRMLYMAGGFGVDTAGSSFTTKAALSAIDVPGLMHWVTNPANGETAAQYIRQIFDPLLQVAGGAMVESSRGRALLVFGQNFAGGNVFANGDYSGQVRRFRIIDNGTQLSVIAKKPRPENAAFMRGNLNVVPAIARGRRSFVALSGVFTPTNGVWTVPVDIKRNGRATMADPAGANTFKQSMNNFVCPTFVLYSAKERASYTLLMGGISLGFLAGNAFQTDPQLPFINQVTAIRRDRRGFVQHLMDGEYPVIPSTGSNPGNTLLFGAGAAFIPADGLPRYANGVLKLDSLGSGPVLAGYIVGGVMSTLPNTNTTSDSAASPFIFAVTLSPTGP